MQDTDLSEAPWNVRCRYGATEIVAGAGYRRTPEGEPKVPDLVAPGTKIKTSYGTGGIVVEVTGPWLQDSEDGIGLETHTIVYVHEEDWPRRRSNLAKRWISELVAVGGRLLMLFEANDDEVLIVDDGTRYRDDAGGQLSMF